MPTLRANGLDIGYDVTGAGPPLILLHGATSLGAEDYAAQLPKLTSAFLVHTPDARGHGRTRWDAAEGFRYDWLVDDLAAFVDGLGIDSFHVLGFSMGASTTWNLLHARPGFFAAAVPIAGVPRADQAKTAHAATRIWVIHGNRDETNPIRHDRRVFVPLADAGATLLVSSHVMDEADRCDRLLLVREGRLLAAGAPAELRRNTGAESLDEVFVRLNEREER